MPREHISRDDRKRTGRPERLIGKNRVDGKAGKERRVQNLRAGLKKKLSDFSQL
jgi:hypothetical protein